MVDCRLRHILLTILACVALLFSGLSMAVQNNVTKPVVNRSVGTTSSGQSPSMSTEVTQEDGLTTILSTNTGIPALTMSVDESGNQDYSVSLQILAIMTLLGFLPAIVIMMTSFTRVIVVMGILRQAMGLQQTPPNQVIIGIALFLTFFIMSPVLDRINTEAVQPYLKEDITAVQALDNAKVPLKQFMLNQTRLKDLETFVKISGAQVIETEDVPMTVLIPAFVTSELKTAFQIGFMLFLPFLVIDLVVASVLMAMGMMMLSPMIVSLPFKIMLFVLVDGWSMIMATLANSFGG